MVAALLAALLAAEGCGPAPDERVEASGHDSFWLWAGVRSRAQLRSARTLYLLDGEIRAAEPGRYIGLRPGIPRLVRPEVWLVVRTDTLDWPGGTVAALTERLDRWASAGNRTAGLQVDFDANSRGLVRYGAFLRSVRQALPRRYRLSITGLMDWSSNGDPAALSALAGTVDEVVVQTYQGRSTIPGYEAWFRRMRGFPIPFKVGLVEGGIWRAPPGLESEPRFRGYVVFLVNPAGEAPPRR